MYLSYIELLAQLTFPYIKSVFLTYFIAEALILAKRGRIHSVTGSERLGMVTYKQYKQYKFLAFTVSWHTSALICMLWVVNFIFKTLLSTACKTSSRSTLGFFHLSSSFWHSTFIKHSPWWSYIVMLQAAPFPLRSHLRYTEVLLN